MSKTARTEGCRREERERPTLRVGHFAYEEAEPPAGDGEVAAAAPAHARAASSARSARTTRGATGLRP
jgi:hypothetical protein